MKSHVSTAISGSSIASPVSAKGSVSNTHQNSTKNTASTCTKTIEYRIFGIDDIHDLDATTRFEKIKKDPANNSSDPYLDAFVDKVTKFRKLSVKKGDEYLGGQLRILAKPIFNIPEIKQWL